MSQVSIWPAKGLAVPFPYENSSGTLPTSGYTGSSTPYIERLLRSGRVVDKDPLATGNLPDVKLQYAPFGGELQRAITPQMFGAAGDSDIVNNAGVGKDDTAALQAFFDYVCSHECRAELTGTFVVSGKITAQWTTSGARRVHCHARIVASTSWSTESEMLSILDAQYVYFSGRLELRGNSGTSEGSTWSSRKTGVGLTISGCTRAKFDFLRLKAFKYWGARIMGTGNSSMLDFGHVVAHDCGQWQQSSSGAQTTAFTVTEVGGTSGSASQYTKMSVGVIPPSDTYDSQDNYVNALVAIEGKLYLMEDLDEANKIITLFPWITVGGSIATVGTTGTLAYFSGGAIDVQGSDGGVLGIGLLDAIRCGIALWSRTFYGPVVRRLVTQFCGIGVAVGRSNDSAHRTLVIDGFYCEQNQWDLVQVTTDNAGVYIMGPYALTLAKCATIAWPLLSPSGNRTSTKLNGVNILGREGNLFYDRRSDTGENDIPIVELFNYMGPLTLYGDNKFRDSPANSGILLRNGDTSYQTLWGAVLMTMTAHGTGARGQPTGKYRFVCDAGYTVNGGTNAEFSGFTNVPIFVVRLQGTNWLVSCLHADAHLAASATVDPPSLAAGAVSSISTVTVTGAALGDYVDRSFSRDLAGVVIDAWVSAADTVSYQFRNTTGSTVDLGSGTLRLRVRRGS